MNRESFGDSAPEIRLDNTSDYEEAFDKPVTRASERLMNLFGKLQKALSGSGRMLHSTDKEIAEKLRQEADEILMGSDPTYD
ncbi:hypothetical protein BGZ76_002386 [Entomortierella beljakovae]|nr:hypothetical protein BGZ76_002386 [Entomortierella beljakovae]